MSKEVLIERGDTCVWIEEQPDGNVRISGQTLRSGSEYEYSITIEPKDFDAIRQAAKSSRVNSLKTPSNESCAKNS